ncbi:hypothetical protein MSG28_012406 [Choristoneura fumiferana]|uniref:Uncharacterized protein n=1 Tax=Choristoneura fumiferana TaxID=7141 RepID=A0ACC0KD14_CHOFU|nr:hypothetical protein MSG28_012406 [Choristoneura fumiferana]
MCANAVARISTVTTTYLVVAEVRLKVALARAASATTKIGKRFEIGLPKLVRSTSKDQEGNQN